MKYITTCARIFTLLFFLVTPSPNLPFGFGYHIFPLYLRSIEKKIILYMCTNNTVASVPFSLPIEPFSSNNCPALSEFRRIKAIVETGHLYGSTEYIWTLLYLSLEVTFTPPPEEEEILLVRGFLYLSLAVSIRKSCFFFLFLF